MKPTAIDLFAGCGGLSLGLKLAGFRVRGAAEIDPLAVETYRANHRGVRVWPVDIRDLTVAEVRRRLRLRPGELDLLAGCPPCQGFSRMTTLNGGRRRQDPRNDLVLEFVRFVRGLRPRAVMLENVPKLARDRRCSALISELESLGYNCKTAVLNAADYGVPQRRNRFILLAVRRGSIDFAPPSSVTRTVRDAIGKLSSRCRADPLHTLPSSRSADVRALIQRIPKDGGSRRDLGETDQLECHLRCDGFGDVYGRMAWDEVAPTITGGCCNPSKGRFLHPTLNRTISLREAALLQSFPPTYQFSLRRGKFPAAQMIGNALPPEFVRRHAESVLHNLLGVGA